MFFIVLFSSFFLFWGWGGGGRVIVIIVGIWLGWGVVDCNERSLELKTYFFWKKKAANKNYIVFTPSPYKWINCSLIFKVSITNERKIFMCL